MEKEDNILDNEYKLKVNLNYIKSMKNIQLIQLRHFLEI